ncbi:hypothetical protein AMK59_5490, partial [Oryctes borbonicus]
MIQRLQLTLAILKPHLVSNPLAVRDIRTLILTNKFKIVNWKRHTLTIKDAEKFYEEHKTKFFYNRLVTFMISGPSEMYILARENAIAEWRRLMGPTKVFKTQFEVPESIRGVYGYSDTRNATHGSDSDESARREIGIFFPEFNYENWYNDEEQYFRTSDVEFSNDLFIHRIKSIQNLV